MEVEVSATGRIKKIIPNQIKVSIKENSNVKDLMDLCGIPNTGIGYVVNGLIGRKTDLLHDGDIIKFIMVVGAG